MNYKRFFIPNSLVFITVVTKYRRNILIDHIACLRQAFVSAKAWHEFHIVAIIVNPDHFHMIIQPKDPRYHIRSTKRENQIFGKDGIGLTLSWMRKIYIDILITFTITL